MVLASITDMEHKLQNGTNYENKGTRLKEIAFG
jgi:hypothetical protein